MKIRLLLVANDFASCPLVWVSLALLGSVPNLHSSTGKSRKFSSRLLVVTVHSWLGSGGFHIELVSPSAPEVIFVWYKVASAPHLHLATATIQLKSENTISSFQSILTTLYKTVHLLVCLWVSKVAVVEAPILTVCVVYLPHFTFTETKPGIILLFSCKQQN